MAGIIKMASGKGKKGKVVVVMGATATGKSKLAVDLALRFGGEVVNSDKIQVHDGLDVVTNKATAREQAGVRHHLIGGVDPDADYPVSVFCCDVTRAVESVVARGRVPVLAGGSNRYLEALLDGGDRAFRARYDLCFLWVDADLTVLDQHIRGRVDYMVEQGLVAEVREFYRPDADYSLGIRRAIGVPEMDAYFRLEATGALDGHDALHAGVLAAAVDEIKENTCRLARRQLQKIHRLCGLPSWRIRRLDATRVLALKVGEVDDAQAERAAWEADVLAPTTWVVKTFLGRMLPYGGRDDRAEMEAAIVAGADVAAHSCGLQLVEAAPSRGFHGRKAAAAV